MKIEPQKTYRVPDYPTIHAAGCAQALLARIPKRWKTSPAFSALMGIGLMAKTLMAGADATPARPSTPAPQSQDQSSKTSDTRDTATQTRKTTTLVAPVLAEALAHDGRGSYGCIAVNPPVFLSEAEAMELIHKELKAVGLELKHGVTLEGMQVPDTSRAGQFIQETLIKDGKSVYQPRPREDGPALIPGKFVFDLADAKRAVYIEYLSLKDYRAWMGRGMSTAQSCNFPSAVHKVSAALEKRHTKERTIFGVFFDPLATVSYSSPDTTGLTREQSRMVTQEHRRVRSEAKKNLHATAKEKLQEQVQHFITTLRQEGVLKKQP
jgi:hypothetical protein